MVLLVLCDSYCVVIQHAVRGTSNFWDVCAMLILVLFVSTAFWTLQPSGPYSLLDPTAFGPYRVLRKHLLLA